MDNGEMDDESLLAQWADRAGMPAAVKAPGVVHGWGDMEVSLRVRASESGFDVIRSVRGSETVEGRFDALADADAFLLASFGSFWRADRGLGDAFPEDPATGTTLTKTDDGWLAEANGRQAAFRLRRDAKRFTRIAGLTLADVATLLLT